MIKKLKKLIQFLKDVSQDNRIPDRDKKVLIALIALILSPIDFIPDWIPILGVLDDLFIMALILDYFFSVLQSDVLLTHYPFGTKSFIALKRTAKMVSWITPNWLRDKIWQYQPPAY